MGRPSKYNDALAAEICDRIAGGESLRKITSDAHVPSLQAVRIWLREKPAFLSQYVRAREAQADYFADEIIDIADSVEDPAFARIAATRIEARKWAAGKMRPKVYGDRMNLGGTDDPIRFSGADSDEALASRMARLAPRRKANGDARKANGSRPPKANGVGV